MAHHAMHAQGGWNNMAIEADLKGFTICSTTAGKAINKILVNQKERCLLSNSYHRAMLTHHRWAHAAAVRSRCQEPTSSQPSLAA